MYLYSIHVSFVPGEMGKGLGKQWLPSSVELFN